MSSPPWHGSPAAGGAVPQPPRPRPSGLFPGRAPRPIYREPFPARAGAVFIGVVAGAVWMLLFGLLAHGARSYAWSTIGAAVVAWVASAILARSGDRGVAAGVSMSAGVGLAIAVSVILTDWVGGHWVLW